MVSRFKLIVNRRRVAIFLNFGPEIIKKIFCDKNLNRGALKTLHPATRVEIKCLVVNIWRLGSEPF